MKIVYVASYFCFLSQCVQAVVAHWSRHAGVALVISVLAIPNARAAYANLTLMQEIDAGSATGANYEESGAVSTQTLLGGVTRVASGSNSWFGYKLGSSLQIDRPYVIEVIYPEDTPRAYLMLLMDCGGWQPGSHFAFHTGVFECEDSRFFWPENKTAYPLRQGYKSYWIVAWPQSRWSTSGEFSAFQNTHGTWDTGLWLYFINKADDGNNAGLAIKGIRLYSVNNVNDLVDPQVEQLRLTSPLRTYWTLETDARNTYETLIAKARIAGANTLVPNLMAWNFANGEYAYYEGHFRALLDRMLPAARANQVGIIPKLEYGGSPSLPAEAWCVTANNVGYDQERNTVGHGNPLVRRPNVRSAAVRQDLYRIIDALFDQASSGSNQIKGIMLRNRLGFFAPSFSDADLVAYESETGRTITGLTADDKRATLRTEIPWKSSWKTPGVIAHIENGHRHLYMQWFYGKVSLFLADVENYLKTNYGKDKVLLYHPYSAEGIFRQMPSDQSRFLSGQEWGFEPGIFASRTFLTSAPVDQYWNAGSAAHINAYASSGGTAVLVDPMYVEYGWNSTFNYSDLAPSFEHGGQEYSIRSELLAVANSNPRMLGKSDFSTLHRGFPDQWNSFAKNFYLIPDEAGSVILNNANITAKSYSGGRVLVINKSLSAQTVNLSASYPVLYDKITGSRVNESSIPVGACSMIMLGSQSGGLPAAPAPLVFDAEPVKNILEAENATFSGGSVDTSIYPYCSGEGVYNFASGAGSWVEFEPNVTQAGLYRLEVRYALASGTRALQLTVDGQAVSATSYPATGNGRVYETMVFENIPLVAGRNTVRLTATLNDGPNIDYIEIVKPGTGDLFAADFEIGAATRWSSGVRAPWSLASDGGSRVYRSALVWSATEFNLAGETYWKDYELKADVKITEMQPWSYSYIFARYTNASNYYQVTLEKTDSATRIRLSKRAGGITTVLASANVGLNVNQWCNVSLRLKGGALVVALNGSSVINFQDASPLPRGKIGIATQKQAVSFDNVTVTRF